MPNVICTNCDAKFEKKTSEIKKSTRHFCNRSCHISFQNRQTPKRQRSGVCLQCKGPSLSSRKFCSLDCYSKYRKRPLTSYEAVQAWRVRIKQRAVEYKGGKCQLCNYSRCLRSMCFHHIDPNAKEFGIASKNRTWEQIRKELDKCVLLCANCHGEVHDGLISIDILTPLLDATFL